jgi:hypothetical protein
MAREITALMMPTIVEMIAEMIDSKRLTATRPPTAIAPYTRIFRGRDIYYTLASVRKYFSE